jgi:hypothetical protein
MPILTEEEAEALDEELTSMIPEANPNIEGPFIKNYRQSMMITLDQFSAKYIQARMLATKQTPAELISSMIKREMAASET